MPVVFFPFFIYRNEQNTYPTKTKIWKCKILQMTPYATEQCFPHIFVFRLYLLYCFCYTFASFLPRYIVLHAYLRFTIKMRKSFGWLKDITFDLPIPYHLYASFDVNGTTRGLHLHARKYKLNCLHSAHAYFFRLIFTYFSIPLTKTNKLQSFSFERMLCAFFCGHFINFFFIFPPQFTYSFDFVPSSLLIRFPHWNINCSLAVGIFLCLDCLCIVPSRK